VPAISCTDAATDSMPSRLTASGDKVTVLSSASGRACSTVAGAGLAAAPGSAGVREHPPASTATSAGAAHTIDRFMMCTLVPRFVRPR
jgi:hypothetical protein